MEAEVKGKSYQVVRYFFILVALFAVFTYLHYFIKTLVTSGFYDFSHYFIYSKLLGSGINIYIEPQGILDKIKIITLQSGIEKPGIIGLLHSPGFLVFVFPFTFLPFKLASLAWVILCQGAFITSVILLCRRNKPDNFIVLYGMIFLAFSFWPIREDLYLGQPNAIILLFFTIAVFFIKKNKLITAGIFVGLGVVFKEIFLPIFIFLVLKRYRKVLASALTVFLLPKIINIVLFGIDKEIFYWKWMLSRRFFDYSPHDVLNISILSFFARITDFLSPVIYVKIIVIIINVIILVFALRFISSRRVAKPELEFSFFIVFCFMVSPWLHQTHLVVLLLPLLLCWDHLVKRPVSNEGLLFIIMYLFIGLRYSSNNFEFFNRGLPHLLAAGKTYGFILFYFLLYKILNKPDFINNG